MRTIILFFVTTCSTFYVLGQNSEHEKPSNSIDTTKLISYKMKYPVKAKRKGIQGTVKIKVTFDSTCNIIKRVIVKSVGYGCDEEALTALTNIERRIKRENNGKCKNGEEIIYPFQFKLD